MPLILIAGLDLGSVRFPGRAGELQRLGASGPLVNELGSNYALYHSFLAAQLEGIGSRPDPDAMDTLDEYIDAWVPIQDLIQAEVILRNCRAYILEGRPLNAPYDPDWPKVVDADRLVSVEVSSSSR